MLSLPSQVLLRNASLFEQGRWALVNPSDASIFNELNNSELIGLHQFMHLFNLCKNNSKHSHYYEADFQLTNIGNQSLDGAVIYLPKAKPHLTMLLDNLSALVKQDAPILVVGENKAGIKSVAKLLEKLGGKANKIDSAKHCALFAISNQNKRTSFSLSNYELAHSHTVNDHTVELVSLPGVFGHKQLDPGTQLLLEQFTPDNIRELKGELYDFACGTGVIGCYLGGIANKYKNQLNISMSDNFALAVYCSKRSLSLNKLDANVSAVDGFVEAAGKRFDHIVSNPPFHEGIRNEYKITENFIRHAYSNSARGGKLTIVANRFLPYPDILENVYSSFSEVSASNKYRVYQSIKSNR